MQTNTVWFHLYKIWSIDAFELRLEKTLESPLDCKEIQLVHPKGNKPCIFIGRTDAEAEASGLWPPDMKSWLLEKTLMLGKIEGGRRRGWQTKRWLDGITNSMDTGYEQALGDGEEQGSLVCLSPLGYKELDTTEQLNNNKYMLKYYKMCKCCRV